MALLLELARLRFGSCAALGARGKIGDPPNQERYLIYARAGCRGRREGTWSDARVGALGQPAAGGPQPNTSIIDNIISQ